jgi:hypothetical protein
LQPSNCDAPHCAPLVRRAGALRRGSDSDRALRIDELRELRSPALKAARRLARARSWENAGVFTAARAYGERLQVTVKLAFVEVRVG